MSANTKIEWTDSTWNPVVGCDDVSPGCANCYAKRTIWRLQHNPNPKIAAANAGLTHKMANGRIGWIGGVNCLPERLEIPLHWKTPKKIFVNSQSDLFHKDVPDAFIDEVFSVMTEAHWHTYQVLTKRPERMAQYMCSRSSKWFRGYPQSVWLGTSVEDQKTANERIPHLLGTPAAIRFLSCEPLLGLVKIVGKWENESGEDAVADDGIHWVICGGESGPGARPMNPAWARSLRDQCSNAGVDYFFKQWGEWVGGSYSFDSESPLSVSLENEKEEVGEERDEEQDARFYGWWESHSKIWTKNSVWADPLTYTSGLCSAHVGKKNAGRLLDGREHNGFPEPLRP